MSYGSFLFFTKLRKENLIKSIHQKMNEFIVKQAKRDNDGMMDALEYIADYAKDIINLDQLLSSYDIMNDFNYDLSKPKNII